MGGREEEEEESSKGLTLSVGGHMGKTCEESDRTCLFLVSIPNPITLITVTLTLTLKNTKTNRGK